MGSVDRYIEFVQHKVEQIQAYTKNLDKIDVTLSEVKEIIAKRVNISLMFTSEIQRYKRQLKDAQRTYKVWWSELYSEKRRILNPITLAGNKWASRMDIEAEIITDNKEQYLFKIKYIENLEDQVSFMKNLMEDWRSIQMDLTNLVKIFTLEANDLSMSNRIENTYKQGIQRRQKKLEE